MLVDGTVLSIAQATVQGMTILTPDPEIEQYAAHGLWRRGVPASRVGF
jgi:PIN domain nuclease of toxin-antitoxin system